MNPVTFNNSLFVLEQTMPDKHVKARLRAVTESPLIKWSDPTDVGFNRADFQEAFFENSCPRLPFERFRVDGFYHFKGTGFMKFKAWVSQNRAQSKNPGYAVIIEAQEFEDGKVLSFGRGPVLLVLDAHAINPMSENAPARFRYDVNICFLTKTRKFFRNTLNAAELCHLCEWLDKLCIDFYNPHLFLCKTHPPIPQGKSVAWQKAREHFVLLHKSHSANKAEAVGQKVIEDGGTVDRIAHSRRAHFRLLRSPRFRHKQGARVWVKSAWCGPKEWSDRSGQIYKIVEKAQTASNQNETR